MKNKQFKDYLREQERHHIKRSKKRDESDEEATITEDALVGISPDMRYFISATEEMRILNGWSILRYGVPIGEWTPPAPSSWIDSIRYTIQDCKKMLTWHMPHYASAFVTEEYFSHVHNRTLFRRHAAQSPLTLDDQCHAVGLTLVYLGSGEAIPGMDVFPVTLLSELEAVR